MIKETTVAKQNKSIKNNCVIQRFSFSTQLISFGRVSVSISLSPQNNELRSEHVKRAARSQPGVWREKKNKIIILK
jgi:hypothetical protein